MSRGDKGRKQNEGILINAFKTECMINQRIILIKKKRRNKTILRSINI